MRDDSGLAADAYLNWVMNPNTLSTPQRRFLDVDDLIEVYDYGQLVNNSTTTFADLSVLRVLQRCSIPDSGCLSTSTVDTSPKQADSKSTNPATRTPLISCSI